jgi:hypothetical protein
VADFANILADLDEKNRQAEVKPAAPSCEARTYSYSEMLRALSRIAELEAELARLRSNTPMRSSIEVLQRMANGLDPFDRGRFQCAVAALPHESPKLSANVTVQEHRVGYAGQLTEALINKKRRELGLTVIENEPGPEAA